jgi:AraC family transcriptional regulator
MAEPSGNNHLTVFDAGSLALPPGLRTCCRTLVRNEAVSVHLALHEPNYFAAHRYPALQIVVILDGATGEVTWVDGSGQTVHREIKANHVWIVPAGVLHTLRWRRKANLAVMLAARGWAAEFGVDRFLEPTVDALDDYEFADPVIAVVKLALLEVQEPMAAQNAPRIQSLGQCLASRILSFRPDESSDEKVIHRLLHPEVRARVTAYVEANLGMELSVSKLAGEAHMSPSHFCGVFKATTGLTPEQFVLRARLLRAHQLVREGAHTIGQIAHATGFSDHSHLTVQFKRRFGVPPKAYLPSIRYV